MLFVLVCAAPIGAQEPSTPDTAATIAPGPDPRRDWGGIRYFARALVSDAWAVTVAPTRLEGASLVRFAGVLGVGALIVPFDEELWRAALRNADEPVFRHIDDVGKVLEPFSLIGRTNKYYAGGMVAGYLTDYLTGDPRLRWIFEELLISNWLAAASRKTLTYSVGRYRPESGRGAYHFVFWKGTSFPSGHASTIAQLASVLSHHIDWWPATVLLYAGVASVVFERVADSEHWPSDSWLGAWWGWGASQIVIRRREANRLDFVPIFDFATGAVGVSIPVGPR